MWTIIGWYAMGKKSRELDIICVFLNIAMLLLQVILFSILCASPQFYKKNNLILMTVFIVSIISSVIHIFIFIIKCRTKFTQKEKIGEKMLKTQVLKPPYIVKKAIFGPDLHKLSHFVNFYNR